MNHKRWVGLERVKFNFTLSYTVWPLKIFLGMEGGGKDNISFYYMTLLYGKLRERAVCGEFCVLIGYPSRQDGAILPARDCPFRSGK